MRVVLVNPVVAPAKTGFAPHLGLGYLAATLEARGHEVLHFDVSLHRMEELPAACAGAGLVGVSATSFTISDAVKAASHIKREHPHVPIVVGGPHVAIAGEGVLSACEAFDFAVVGEGEYTLSELADHIEKTGTADRGCEIQGLLYRDGTAIVRNASRPWNTALDDLPYPSFDERSMVHYTQYPIITSRGCPYDCIYCASSVVWGRTWRHRQPEKIVGEIEHAIEKYSWGGRPFCIHDDTFNLDVGRSQAFCEMLVQRGLHIRYTVQGIRADRVDGKLADSLKASGCQAVAIGIESANPGVLTNIRKSARIEDIARGIRLLRDAGIVVLGQFMIGNPGDSIATVRESITFIRKTGLDVANFYLALPYPGTNLWKYVEEHGRFLQHDFTQFHHYSDRPIFETPQFSEADRRKAFRMAQRFTQRRRTMFAVKNMLSGKSSRGNRPFAAIRTVIRRGLEAMADMVLVRPKKW